MTPARSETKFDLIVSLIPFFSRDSEKDAVASLYDWYIRPEVFQISRPFNNDEIQPAKTVRELIEYYLFSGQRPAVLNSLTELWVENAPWNKG